MISGVPIFNIPIYDNGKKVGEYDLLNQQCVQVKIENKSPKAEPSQVKNTKAERSWWWMLLFGGPIQNPCLSC